MKKILALLLVVVMLLGLTACGARVVTQMDANKTQLYVGYKNGGLGEEWIRAAAAKFEEEFADYSFEEGKKGVQIMFRMNKTEMGGVTLVDTILGKDNMQEVYFTEGINYYYWASTGRLYPITDVVNGDLSDYGDTGSIADKMTKEQMDALTYNGDIYALPFFQGNTGLVYNATLFDRKGWYFDADGDFTDASGNLGTGPDGKTGTYDDGLPRTYDDFFKLCDRIVEDNCLPVQWSGAAQEYTSWFTAALAADAMGFDAYSQNYSFSGTAELVKPETVDLESMTWETEQVAITAKNGYELARQEGLLYALCFTQRLLQNVNYHDLVHDTDASFTHLDAQTAFVRNTTTNDKDVAMLMDGDWWENEASLAFTSTYGNNATKYDSQSEYKVMPLPKATEEKIGETPVQVDETSSYAFIKGTIAEEKVEVAKTFLQFMHTEAQMAAFTETTGVKKPYSYNVDESKLTAYAKSEFALAEASKIAIAANNNELLIGHAVDFRVVCLVRNNCNANKQVSDLLVLPFTTRSGNVYAYDAADVFNSIYDYRKNSQWSTYY